MTVRLGVYAMPVDRDRLDYVIEAERLGVDSAWVAEFWGYDALTPLGAAAAVTDTIRPGSAIVQIGTRTTAMLAMSVMSLQQLSGGRFLLGIGASGPQVIEGWHGLPFTKPVRRTRKTIEILRMVTGGERLTYDGDIYRLPLPDGQGKALRSAARPVNVPVYVASLGPANLRLTGAAADGWIGNSFFCETAYVFFDEIRAGAESSGRSLDDIDLTVSVGCEITDDVEAAGRRHAVGFAFTFGAMGSAFTGCGRSGRRRGCQVVPVAPREPTRHSTRRRPRGGCRPLPSGGWPATRHRDHRGSRRCVIG
jgi:alkanesulfonate monooxygenase SsuD/methylene tetrahydromethanopterin reductase-like flavin-dependent oxidoreductase (luciferase family)